MTSVKHLKSWWPLTFHLKARDDFEIRKYEEKGGNVEILEHFAEQIALVEDRENLLKYFQKYLKEEQEHRSAEIFLKFVESGGSLETLKKCLELGSKTPGKINILVYSVNYDGCFA